MKYKVIAIEREYASGGSEIGEKLGEKLGIPCYGHEILEKGAAKLNVSVEYLRNAEENIKEVCSMDWRHLPMRQQEKNLIYL